MSWCTMMRYPAATLTVLITLVYPLTAPTVHRIDKDHYYLLRRIAIRNDGKLVEADFEGVFGVPAGTYGSMEDQVRRQFGFVESAGALPDGGIVKRWVSDELISDIEFDGRGNLRRFGNLMAYRDRDPFRRWWRKLLPLIE